MKWEDTYDEIFESFICLNVQIFHGRIIFNDLLLIFTILNLKKDETKT